MKLLLHIGTEKTATTTLQRYFYENRVNYNKSGTHIITSLGCGNNRALVSVAMNNDRFDDYHTNKNIFSIKDKDVHNKKIMDAFELELTQLDTNIDKVVITSEHFQSRLTSDEEVEKLKSILDKYFDEIFVFVYVRPQIEVIQSLYSTILKSGGVVDFSGFINNNPNNMKEYYDYEGLLTRWRRSFGKDKITLRVFDKRSFKDGDIISDICDVMSIEKFNTVEHSLNESLIPIAQEVIRQCNTNPTIFKKMLREQVLSDNNSYGKGQTLSANQAKDFQNKFNDANNQLALEWLQRDSLFNINYDKYEEGNKIEDSTKTILSTLIANTNKLLNSEIDLIRDVAISIEKTCPDQAESLLEIAMKHRPNGKFIKKKLEALRNNSNV